MRKIIDTSHPINLIEYISDAENNTNSRYLDYSDKEIKFKLKMNKTEYEVKSQFDVQGKKTIFEQFKNLILSQN